MGNLLGEEYVMTKEREKKVQIAVIIVGWNMDYRLELLEGMYEAADLYHCALHIFTCMGGFGAGHPYSKGEYDIFELPDYSLYDGIVFISNTVFAESVVQRLSEKFSKLHTPVICTDNRVKDFGFMGTDNYIAMKSLMEHMVKVHNYKNFRMIAGPKNNKESNLRIKAFTDVLTEHGIEVKDEHIYNANYIMNGAIDAVHYFLEHEKEVPDAFICANDLMALTTCWELQRLGYQVPEDVAVTGFDNIKKTETYRPSITSIGRAKKKMGMEAVKALVKHILGENDTTDFYIPYELCIRESCGCNIKKEVSFDEFARKLYNEDMEKQLMSYLATSMEDDLVGCRTYEDFTRSIRNHVPKRFIKKFFVCLNQSVADMLRNENESIEKLLYFTRETTQYDSVFSIPVAYDNGNISSYEKMKFEAILELVDNVQPAHNKDHEDIAYFMPLHFREKCFGFMAFAGNRANITNDFIGHYVKKIANCLEQLRIHRIENLTISRLEDLYETDSMTGLYNRFGYKKRIKELVKRYENSNDSIVVQFFDMDELKYINDAYGHDAGNKAIMIVVECMKKVYKGDFLIRYGGDEFIALGVNQTDESMRERNRQFKEMLLEETIRQKFRYPISVSMGYHIAKHPEKANAEMWINCADKAMYIEKVKRKCDREKVKEKLKRKRKKKKKRK